MHAPLTIRAQRNFLRDEIDFLFSSEGFRINGQAQGPRVVMQPPTMVPWPADHVAIAPSLSLQEEEAQNLMDALWHCGIRPKEGTGSAGSLAATERHLADMQKVAFGALKRLGVEEP